MVKKILTQPEPGLESPSGLDAMRTLSGNSSHASAGASPTPAPKSFEDAMAELEQLVGQMEAGALPLEASVTAYQRGAELVRFCNAQLERVDQQVKMLEGDVLKPLISASHAAENAE